MYKCQQGLLWIEGKVEIQDVPTLECPKLEGAKLHEGRQQSHTSGRHDTVPCHFDGPRS